MSTAIYALLAAGLVLFGGATVAAFYWAARNGQFRNLDEGARSIFGEDEPVGAATDTFADRRPDVPLRRPAFSGTKR